LAAVSPRAQPEQQPPPEQRLRERDAKRGRARFASHRDIGRAVERALRRAGIPMAFSSGFSPHPRISYAGASPTGAASESEYLELALASARDPEWVLQQLNAALPTGLAVLAVADSPHGSLADLLTASQWRLELPGVPEAVAAGAVAALLGSESHLVERMTKTGMRSFDVRGAVLRLETVGDGLLDLVSAIGAPLVRPDDVVQALVALEPGVRPAAPPVFTRLAQGTWDSDTVVDPLPVSHRPVTDGME
jgi:radical SAM-linked protein